VHDKTITKQEAVNFEHEGEWWNSVLLPCDATIGYLLLLVFNELDGLAVHSWMIIAKQASRLNNHRL